ncbi:MAG TPA: glycosyltransferase family 39 protein [Anaeromyxobacter sp.]|nr:glycosyltransferase family 39 protein [Anaeromyxobacter sp.]
MPTDRSGLVLSPPTSSFEPRLGNGRAPPRAAARSSGQDGPASSALALDASRPEHVALALLCCAAVLPLLLVARSADGNAFTSWRWVFTSRAIAETCLLLVPAIAVAHVAARTLGERARRVLLAVPPLAVLPLWAAPETILDASRYFLQAKFLAEYGVSRFLAEWGRGVDAWTDLPLVPFLYGVVFSVAGESRPWIQALDTGFLAGAALLTWRIGRALWGEDAGVEAALLLAGIPFLLVQVPLLLVDVPTMFFLALAAHALLAAVRAGGAGRIAAGALACSAAALSKYSAWPMLLALAAACVVAAPDRRRGAARGAAVLLAGAALTVALLLGHLDVVRRQLDLLATYQRAGLGRWQEGLLSTFAFQAHPLVAAFAAVGAARALRSRDRRFAVPGCALVLAILVGAARARYVVPLLPFVALAAAHGLGAVADRGIRTLLATSIVATSLLVTHLAYLPFLQGTSLANLAHAGAFLDRLPGSTVVVLASPQASSSGSTFAAIPLLDYASRKTVVSPQEWPAPAAAPGAATSSLRFSWELRRPAFYRDRPADPGEPIAAISDGATGPPPGAGAAAPRRFDRTDEVFRFQTVVTVHAASAAAR